MMGKTYHAKWHQDNKERCRANNKAWRLANPERVKAIEARSYKKKKDGLFRKKYGISEEDYLKMHEAQNGLCAICNQPPESGILCVDHEHSKGFVRGLLCRRCNTGIGSLRDSPEILMRAAVYIKSRIPA